MRQVLRSVLVLLFVAVLAGGLVAYGDPQIKPDACQQVIKGLNPHPDNSGCPTTTTVSSDTNPSTYGAAVREMVSREMVSGTILFSTKKR
jgi:hypothetical protein